jgi:hypothetical protein
MKTKEKPKTKKNATVGKRTPFDVTKHGVTLHIQVTPHEDRYLFNNHFVPPTSSGRAKKEQSKYKEVIEKVAYDLLEKYRGSKITLPRKEYEPLNRKALAYDDMEKSLEGTGLTIPMFLGQLIPTARRLHEANVVVAKAFEDGAACHLPRKPMTVEEVVKTLLPCVKENSTSKLAADAKPLIKLAAGRYIHLITPVEVEQMLRDFQAGKFLTQEEKDKKMIKKKWLCPPRDKDGREKWFSDKSKKHLFDACRRIFIRAFKLGAWPLLLDLPTKVMEKPKVGRTPRPPLSAASWAKLIPALDRVELRVAVLLFSDVRASEFDRLGAEHIIHGRMFLKGWSHPETLPLKINVPPGYDKAKKENQEGRVVTLLPTMRVLLYLAMPEPGEPLFPCHVEEIIGRIYAKAKVLGIKDVSDNCIRRMHDTYWYGLTEATGVNDDASHTKAMSDRVYRTPASFEDCVRVFRTLPDAPAHLRAWVEDWVGYFERQRGLVVDDSTEPDKEPTAVRAGSDTTFAPSAKNKRFSCRGDADQFDLSLLPGIGRAAAN